MNVDVHCVTQHTEEVIEPCICIRVLGRQNKRVHYGRMKPFNKKIKKIISPWFERGQKDTRPPKKALCGWQGAKHKRKRSQTHTQEQSKSARQNARSLQANYRWNKRNTQTKKQAIKMLGIELSLTPRIEPSTRPTITEGRRRGRTHTTASNHNDQVYEPYFVLKGNIFIL